MTGAETAIAESIASDLGTSYGLDTAGAVPVEGGWLNRKWKLQGPRGPVLVKQYSVERFGPQRLDEVEASAFAGGGGHPLPPYLEGRGFDPAQAG